VICVAAGAAGFRLAAVAFTLGWTHSVERIRWEEDWRATPAGLELVEARVRGSGAGMEPGEGAVLSGGWWRWRPAVRPVPELTLAASGATPGGWSLCAKDDCRVIGAEPGPPIRITPCATR
jgi:hypothetical protein